MVRKKHFALIEVLVTIFVISIALFSFTTIINKNMLMIRNSYINSILIEIIDGEIHIIKAGGWRNIKEGFQPYKVESNSYSNLPPGHFITEKKTNTIQLRWVNESKKERFNIFRNLKI
jgi:hypothetical protein